MPSRRVVLGSLAGTSVALAGCGGRDTTGAWRRAGADRANTGFAPAVTGPRPPLTVLWEASIPGDRAISYPSPVIADSRVYVAWRGVDGDEAVVGLSARDATDGTRLWNRRVTTGEDPRDTDRLVWDSLTLADDALYLLAHDGLHSFTTSGERRWHVPFGGSPTNTVLDAGHPLVADGVVYAPTAGVTDHSDATEGVYALDAASGETVWHYEVPETDFGWTFPPAFGNGLVYVGLLEYGVVALDPATGTVRWETRVPADGPPTVLDGQVVVSIERDGETAISALDAVTGREAWRVPTGGGRLGRRVAVHPAHERIYHRQSLRTLVARDLHTGERRWRIDSFAAVFGGGVAVTPDRLYATVGTGRRNRKDGVAAFDPETGETLGVVAVSEGGLDSSLAVGESVVVTNQWSGPLVAVTRCPVAVGDACLVA